MHTCTMYDSIQDVPPDVWRCLVTEVDFAMDRRLVALQQRTLREQSRMWVLVVRDGANEPAAIACLARFDLEIVDLPGWLRKGVGAMREVLGKVLEKSSAVCRLAFAVCVESSPVFDGGRQTNGVGGD